MVISRNFAQCRNELSDARHIVLFGNHDVRALDKDNCGHLGMRFNGLSNFIYGGSVICVRKPNHIFPNICRQIEAVQCIFQRKSAAISDEDKVGQAKGSVAVEWLSLRLSNKRGDEPTRFADARRTSY